MAVKNLEIVEGDAAPIFSAQDETGRAWSLKDLKGKTVILYFYPKDNTSGCTVEACDFRDSFQIFKKKNVLVLGVSPDSAKSHSGFKAKHELPFPLLVDEQKELCQLFGVWKEKSMYGRKYMGIERSTFVIGPDGKIKSIYRKVSVSGHVKAILESLNASTTK